MARAGPGVAGLDTAGCSVDMMRMEEQLARELARMRIQDDRKAKEIAKLCTQSDEIKELQARINAAYLNKERGSQITENQFRKQIEIVSHQTILTSVCRKTKRTWTWTT